MIFRLAFLFAITVGGASAQTNASYFDETGHNVDSTDATAYYKEWSKAGLLHSTYIATGKIRAEDVKSDNKDLTIRTLFHPNGEKMAIINMERSTKVGLLKTYYSDGREQAVVDYMRLKDRDRDNYRERFMSYRDSTGVQQVVDGEGNYAGTGIPIYDEGWSCEGLVADGHRHGQWLGRNKSGMSYSEVYDKGQLINGSMVADGATYNYTVIGTTAEPVGGMAVFYDHVRSRMTYPPNARSRGIQGKVFVEFVVDVDGKVTNVRAVKGIDPECDAVAVEVVRTSPPWKAGVQRGRPIKQRIIMPLTFRIG